MPTDVSNVPQLTIDFVSAEERKPTLCAGSHKLKKCISPTACECINCLTYNKQNQHKTSVTATLHWIRIVTVRSNIGEVHTEHGLLKWRDTVTPTQNTAIERTNCNQIKCIRINLQHSRLATDNLRRIIEDDSTGILCIQEPYIIQNKISGLSKNYKIFASGGGRNCAATVVTTK